MAFYAGVLGSLTGQAQGKHDAYLDSVKQAANDQQMQMQQQQYADQHQMARAQASRNGLLDQTSIAQANANIAETNAKIQQQQHSQKLDDLANGVGIKPWAPPLNHGVSLTTGQRADQAREEAHYWRSHGASVKADEAEKSVKELDTLSKNQSAAAAKTQEDANHLIEIMARAQNWTEQQKIAMQRIAGQESLQILKGGQQEQQVREKIAGAAKLQVDRDQAALARTTMTVQARAVAQAKIDQTRQAIAQMTSGSANWRALVGKGLEQLDANGQPQLPSLDGYGQQVQPPNVNGGATINVYGGGPGGGASGGVQPPPVGLPPTKVNPANGKTYYLHGDKYYPTP